MKALVLGGYGVFGTIVSRELALRGVAVTVAGRAGARAQALASALGPSHSAAALDADDDAACRSALRGHDVCVSCAGPFMPVRTGRLLEACLDAGCHYADIAEDRASIDTVLRYGPRFAAAGRHALYGCSSLPGLSVPLALAARERGPAGPAERARITLFIGNDNAKGVASVAALSRQLGRPIAAPQGTLRGFRGCARVTLPAPIGRRRACDFDGPEHDLLPPRLALAHVEVKVAFELPLASRILGLMALLGVRPGERGARALARLGNALRGVGTSAGAVMAELWWPEGERRGAALVAARDGQRMAALPCALAVAALSGLHQGGGALLPHELLGRDGLISALAAAGYPMEPSMEDPP